MGTHLNGVVSAEVLEPTVELVIDDTRALERGRLSRLISDDDTEGLDLLIQHGRALRDIARLQGRPLRELRQSLAAAAARIGLELDLGPWPDES